MNKIKLDEYAEIYIKYFGENSSFKEIKDSYNSWIETQSYMETITQEEKDKYTYCVYSDFPTAESWVEHMIKERDLRISRSKATQEWMRLPWYERQLYDSPIKNKIISAFINDQEGIKISNDLILWNISCENIFNAIKHFSKHETIETTDEKIMEFLKRNKDFLDNIGKGVACDGGRVLTVINVACSLFYKEFSGIYLLGENENKNDDVDDVNDVETKEKQ